MENKVKVFLCFFFLVLMSQQLYALTFAELKSEMIKQHVSSWQVLDPEEFPEGAKKFEQWKERIIGSLSKEAERSLLIDAQKEDQKHRDELSKEIPPRWDWREVDGKNWLTRIKDQGFCSSCAATSSVDLFEIMLNIVNKAPGLNLDLSEQYVFSQVGICNRGVERWRVIKNLKEAGIPDESCFPYESGMSGEDIDISAACADAKDRVYKLDDSRYWNGSSFRAALQGGPIVTGMHVYEDFIYYKDGIYEHVAAGNSLGYHAVVVVGYDDVDQAWIVKNSWGPEWGDHGYFKIRYDQSGIARDGNQYKILPRKYNFLKTTEPLNFSFHSQDIILKVESFADGAKLDHAFFKLYNSEDQTQMIEGAIDTSSMQQVISLNNLKDGRYTLIVDGHYIDNSRPLKPWHSTVYITREPQPIEMQIKLDADHGKPISGLRNIFLETKFDQVPLSDVEIVIKNIATNEEWAIELERPGRKAKLTWRTANYVNGDYELFAIGRIGEFQEFKSPIVKVLVKN